MKVLVLLAAALIGFSGITVCGQAVEDQVRQRVEEKVEQGKQRAKKEFEKGKQRLEQEGDRARSAEGEKTGGRLGRYTALGTLLPLNNQAPVVA